MKKKEKEFLHLCVRDRETIAWRNIGRHNDNWIHFSFLFYTVDQVPNRISRCDIPSLMTKLAFLFRLSPVSSNSSHHTVDCYVSIYETTYNLFALDIYIIYKGRERDREEGSVCVRQSECDRNLKPYSIWKGKLKTCERVHPASYWGEQEKYIYSAQRAPLTI